MLGNMVPQPGDPRINLNNQPWSLPVVFNATTASLRWQQKLTNDWKLTTHVATQRLRNDDLTPKLGVPIVQETTPEPEAAAAAK